MRRLGTERGAHGTWTGDADEPELHALARGERLRGEGHALLEIGCDVRARVEQHLGPMGVELRELTATGHPKHRDGQRTRVLEGDRELERLARAGDHVDQLLADEARGHVG